MTDIKQCWAFHKDGMRCEHPAGHNGDHVVQKTWTDEECAAPGESAPGTSNPIQVSVPHVLQEQSIKCVACSHAHKNGECKCGCHEFIG